MSEDEITEVLEEVGKQESPITTIGQGLTALPLFVPCIILWYKCAHGPVLIG
jgi:hypothetical protein